MSFGPSHYELQNLKSTVSALQYNIEVLCSKVATLEEEKLGARLGFLERKNEQLETELCQLRQSFHQHAEDHENIVAHYYQSNMSAKNQKQQCKVSTTQNQAEITSGNSISSEARIDQNDKLIAWTKERQDVAVDLRASVCKLLWVAYEKLADDDRVQENLQEIYRMDWKNPTMDVEQVIETQLKFLQKLRPEMWENKRYDIARILQENNHLRPGVELTSDHVINYLKEHGYEEKHQFSRKRAGQNRIGLIEIWRKYGEPLPDQNGEKELAWAPPEDMTKVSIYSQKENIWDTLLKQRKRLAQIFECSEELDNLEIPSQVRNFWRKSREEQRQASPENLKDIEDTQSKVLKT